MFVSEARILANRRNAQLSSGPRTAEGKARSRANALKHGLCSSVVVEEDAELVQERSTQLFYALRPQNHYHHWLVDKAAVLSLRIDRSERIERRVRDKIALKAELSWDLDRQLEVEVLGSNLASEPAETVTALKKTPQGCEWLMTRWAMLAFVADADEGWTEEQTNLAFDLLATPRMFRKGRKPGDGLDFNGNLNSPATDLAAVARREIASLKALREVAADLDEVDQALTETDLTNDREPELRRLRRYESTLHRRFRWCVAQINGPSPYKCPMSGLSPSLFGPPLPEEKPDKPTEDEKLAAEHPVGSIHPPFCLEPDEYPEPGQKPDIPAILKSRRQKKLRKAEAQRVAQRRRVEKLRA